MKTAKFEYTKRVEVDSSLAKAVYYDSETHMMSVEFHSGGSAIYGAVPEPFFEGFSTVDSIGKVYNSFVKVTFPNLSGGTVYDVTYIDKAVVRKEVSNRYTVKGYVRFSGDFAAGSTEEARELFLDSLIDEGYDEDDLAITEVYFSE